ncbi:ABC transporter ATP-binding protein [Xylanibacillus composti]|uniref:ABC transporter ATP-binding protein n=1 Tax=Xylanibacillus composti TaxID=1572762 RepID=A0A8J4H1F0_9BACL|nr:ABC transporter ATP-binding protein [Xylanibacillus composti]MDT9725357.1 ABC transporter ATP-binding protein [Xylanibacillus composti]GIQ69119.1 ABC transporter ATP-binding protein [Xylanibacillus composti]
MSAQPVLSVKQVMKKIGNQTIIRSLSFAIERGTVFGLIGENGAGKTTVLGMVCGLIAPTSGTIHVEGMPVSTMRKQVLRRIGALIEEPHFYKYLTGMEHMLYGSRLYGEITSDRIAEVLSLLKLEDFIHKKVGQYSLGMKKRLAIAQCLLHKPTLLILDEPTNGLDPGAMIEFREMIRSIASKFKLSVLISSHHLREIENICHQFGLLQNGTLTLLGANKSRYGDSVVFVIEAEDPGRAVELLEQQSYIFEPQRSADGKITFVMERSHYSSLLLLLSQAGVRSIQEKSFDLEEAYLQMTRKSEGGGG